MAQLLPDKEKQRPLAYMLLVIAVILVYWFGFHWFFQAHAELNERAEGLQQAEARFAALIALKPKVEQELQGVRDGEQQSDYFLQQENVSLASSELTSMLKQTINLHADHSESCQVSSNQNMRVRVQERFQRVTIKVRMRCELDDLSKVFYNLEGETPYVFIDNVSIYRQISRRRRGRETVQQRVLDVRFDLSGYIRISGMDEA
jgi:general secretion pathway protein M